MRGALRLVSLLSGLYQPKYCGGVTRVWLRHTDTQERGAYLQGPTVSARTAVNGNNTVKGAVLAAKASKADLWGQANVDVYRVICGANDPP